jgi:hypothetical protein
LANTRCICRIFGSAARGAPTSFGSIALEYTPAYPLPTTVPTCSEQSTCHKWIQMQGRIEGLE